MTSDRILMPSSTGLAKAGDGKLIFNKEVVQMLIDWMDGEPKAYCDCVDFILDVMQRKKLIATRNKACRCVEKLDEFWRLDETQS